MTREEARQFKRKAEGPPRPRNFTYRFRPENEDYQFTLTFKRSEVERQELVDALQSKP